MITQFVTTDEGIWGPLFTQKTLRATLNLAQTENPKITQSKCWNYFKITTQARNIFWVNMGL